MNELIAFARNKVLALEEQIKTLPPVDAPVHHYFGHKSYVRQLFLPKHTVLTGKIHKFDQINILLSGDISVLTEEGVIRIQAPYVFESKAGAKRAGFAHEDSVWLTVHGTDKTNVNEIEDEVISKSFEEFDREVLCLGAR
jgi:hypothetical protein